MRSRPYRFVGAMTFMVCLVGRGSIASAQSFEVTPFGGYRFGGDFFELLTRQPVDNDGAPAVGVAVDVPLGAGLQAEALFSHQNARISVPTAITGSPAHVHITVDHWLGGGLQEFETGRVRPYLTGMLGLTHYAAEDDDEIRFTLGAGGGVKLFPIPNVGVRLNTQVFATFVDADAHLFACGPGTCFIGFNADIAWQIELTAGVILKFK
jgi:hypothetical protein